jgi:hypothetical protein
LEGGRNQGNRRTAELLLVKHGGQG